MKNLVIGCNPFRQSFLWIYPTAEAAWLIDAERFHVAVHGELSCQDCHEDINEKTLHPDPANVNKALKDFFQPEQCTACHEEVAEEIAEGSHGGQEATAWQRFDHCIECHDPHYQVSGGDNDTIPDLNQPVAVKSSQSHESQAELPDFSDERPGLPSVSSGCFRQTIPSQPKKPPRFVSTATAPATGLPAGKCIPIR